MPAYKPAPFAFIDGKIVPTEKANVSIMTNALHYGGGIFGGMKAYKTRKGIEIFRLTEHLERMQRSCKILRFPYELNIETAKRHVLRLAGKNKLTSSTYIRPLIYRCDTDLSPSIEGTYDLAIYMLYMDTYFDNSRGLSVCVSSWRRNSDNALPPRTKATGGYLNSALAIHDAKRAGYDSAILLDEHGNVGEGAVMNIFIVKNNVLITPSLDADILEGITRKTIIELATAMGHTIVERNINRSELYTADEVFFCGTAVEVTWCKAVDSVDISEQPGPVTEKLLKAFHSLPETHPHLFTTV